MLNEPAQQAFLDTLHRDTYGVLTDLQTFVSAEVVKPDEEISLRSRAVMIREAMQATSRMAHVMAWLMLQKALDSGEISDAEARSHEANGFSEASNLSAAEGHPSEMRQLPVELRSLIDRSRRAYDRALTLKQRTA